MVEGGSFLSVSIVVNRKDEGMSAGAKINWKVKVKHPFNADSGMLGLKLLLFDL